MEVKVFDSENFKSEVLEYEGIVIVDFFATWCGPCKIMSGIIDEIAEEVENVKVGKIDVDESSDIASDYGIMSIPTIIIFKNGEIVKTFVGVTDKEEIKSIIK